jgi:predicted MFS family arabinose efflux permease
MVAPEQAGRLATAKHAYVWRQKPPVSRRSRVALDAVNFFLAELTGIGSPFLGDLLLDGGWKYGPIGVAAAMSGLGVCLLQPFAGLYLDRSRHPRVILAAASVAVGGCYALIPSLVRAAHFTVYATLFASGIAQSLFGPALAGLALGLVGQRHLNRTIGMNQAFNHMGDVAAALLTMLIVRTLGVAYVFYMVGVIAVLAGASALLIRGHEIDLERSSGGTRHRVRFTALLRDRNVLVFLVSTMLFQAAYGSAFPFIALRARESGGSDAFVAAVILVAQGFMVPVAIVTGRLLGTWGRRPVLGIAFVALLGYLLVCSFVHGAHALVGLQAFGSVGPGILSVAIVVVCADLTRGTGHFHALTAASGTAMAAGAVVGTFATGFLLARVGYTLAIGALAAVAAMANALFLLRMPETRPTETDAERSP